jgi:hypothetical protein
MRISDTLYVSSIQANTFTVSSLSLSSNLSVNSLTVTNSALLQGTTIVQGSLQISSFGQSYWLATGQGTSNILKSSDGITWTGQSVFSVQGNAVVWNGSYWLAAGEGTSTVYRSSDGVNWIQISESVFTGKGLALAWNGSYWVAVGQGTNTIKYSYDGLTWLNAVSGFTVQGNSLAWNGFYWLAVGEGTNNILKSSDGINWTGQSVFTSKGLGIAWNGRYWVALGQGTNTIKYSLNGITWSNASSGFSVQGNSLAWNGSYWIAVGEGTTTNKYSYDGINWLDAATQFTGVGYGVAYTNNLQQSFIAQNLSINGTTQPTFLTSTNSITAGFSSMLILNNTLFIDATNNRVGVNTAVPQADLDVNGTLSKTAGSFDIRHPDPVKAEQGYRLRHCFVESPTRGDNLYRWLLSTTNMSFVLELPSYFQYLNENPMCYVSPVDTFGKGRAVVSNQGTQLTLTTTEDGLWNVLCIATRKDQDAKNYFDAGGVEYKLI